MIIIDKIKQYISYLRFRQIFKKDGYYRINLEYRGSKLVFGAHKACQVFRIIKGFTNTVDKRIDCC